MIKVNLYRYNEEDGSVTITPNKRHDDIAYKERLIAEEGYILSDNVVKTNCIDIDFADEDKWQEIEETNE